LAILALLLATLLPASAQSTNGPARPDYSAFRLITERNIFNPRRYARSGPRPRETRPTIREAFTLVGTMSYEKGPFAFFEGTRSEYRKVLQPDGAIAGYKLTCVQPSYVKLATATNEVQLRVGMQLRRSDEGGWQMAEAEPPPSTPPPSAPSYVRPAIATNAVQAQAGSAPAPTNGAPQVVVIDPASQTVIADSQADTSMTNTAPAEASAGTDDPVLQRLMRQREQQLNQ
jgi:hypothetical protein